ncbi:hypothetical protein BH11PLA1_BH11PLA1_16780 [soil metagenome]
MRSAAGLVTSATLSAAFLLLVAGSASAELITVRSGQSSLVPGSVGQADDTVRYLPINPPGAPVSAAPFTPADFAGALAGPAAHVILPLAPPWTPGISDPAARWINFSVEATGYGTSGSSLYAVPFFVTTPGATTGNLNLEFAVDDGGGDALYGGANPSFLYVNGIATGYAGGVYSGSTFHSQSISLSTGWNTIYLYQRDQGLGVSGLIFSLTVDIVPTPGAGTLLALAGVVATRRRRA